MHKNGFTLIELLLVLALGGATLSLSIQTFKQLSERRLLTQPLALFINSLRFARIVAMSSGHNVTLCPSEDGRSCSSAGYEHGWIVFADKDGGGRRDADEHLFATTQGLKPQLSLRSNTFTSYITFRSNGRANRNGRFVICADKDPHNALGIFVIRSGRVRRATAKELEQCLA